MRWSWFYHAENVFLSHPCQLLYLPTSTTIFSSSWIFFQPLDSCCTYCIVHTYLPPNLEHLWKFYVVVVLFLFNMYVYYLFPSFSTHRYSSHTNSYNYVRSPLVHIITRILIKEGCFSVDSKFVHQIKSCKKLQQH